MIETGKIINGDCVEVMKTFPESSIDLMVTSCPYNVNIKYDTCMCCTENPSISIPLTIIPQTDPSMFGLEEPPGYSPIDLGSFKFSL